MHFDLARNLFLCTIFVNLVAVNKVLSDNNVFKSFNESCDESSSVLCDISVGLICTANKKCACIDDGSIIFEFQTRSCVRLVNSTCGRLIEVADDNVSIPCIAGSECVIESGQSPSLSGVCECSEGYIPDNNGKCSAITRQTPSCATNDDCGTGMTCIEKSCVCVDQEDMIYDEISQSCKSLVDTACFISPIGGVIKNCVDNAECVPENPMVGYCKCRPGFYPDANNKFCVWDGVSPTDPPPSTLSTRQPSTTTTEMTTISTTTVTRITTANPGLGLIGQPCEIEISSTTFSQIQWFIRADDEKQYLRTTKCIPNAFCLMGKCACLKGYALENAKKCVPAGATSLHFLATSTPLLLISMKIALNIVNYI